MNFIRPEAAAQLTRWREVLIGLGVLLPGLWWMLTGTGLIPYLGALAAVLGLVLMALGRQRARFRLAGRGPGIVRITEDQIVYLGPLTGGAVALADLTRLGLDGTGKPAHWVLSQQGGEDLHIPVTAEGAEALFDAFARLPGLRTEHMLGRLRDSTGAYAVIWRSEGDLRRLT